MKGEAWLEHRSKLNTDGKKRSPFSTHAFSTGQLELTQGMAAEIPQRKPGR